MNAFADGVNFYLAKHPEVKPRVIQHFEPWMALSFTEGSIGGDIERVDLKETGSILRRPQERGGTGRSNRKRSRVDRMGLRLLPRTRCSTRTAADQSAYFVFLSVGVTDGQRSKGSMRTER